MIWALLLWLLGAYLFAQLLGEIIKNPLLRTLLEIPPSMHEVWSRGLRWQVFLSLMWPLSSLYLLADESRKRWG